MKPTTGRWAKNPETPEGKYPIVLRRDGTPLEKPYFVLVLGDKAVPAALHAYATAAEVHGYDPQFVADMFELAEEARRAIPYFENHPDPKLRPDPDAKPHRADDPRILAWARTIGCPSQ